MNDDLVRVQARTRTDISFTGEVREVASTELARIVAAEKDWQFNSAGELFDADGAYLVESVEQLAAALRGLRCLTFDGVRVTGINWSGAWPPGDPNGLPIRSVELAERVRGYLPDGTP